MIFFFLLIMNGFLAILSDAQETKVVSLFAAVRHGARAPTNNIWGQETWKSFAKNQLTSVGMRQEFLVGRQLRENYKDLIPKQYSAESIVAISGDQPRIINSLQSLLTGLFYESGPLFPTNIDQDFYNEYVLPPFNISIDTAFPFETALPGGFQPVPIHFNNMSFDLLTEFNFSCRGLFDHVWDMKEGNIVSEIDAVAQEKLDDLLPFIQTAQAGDPFYEFGDIYDTALADLYFNQSLPFRSDTSNWELARFVYDELEASEFREAKFQKAFAGDFVNFIYDSLNIAVLDPKTTKRLHIVQTHDSNLNALLSMFNRSSPECLLEYFKSQKEADSDCMRTPKYSSVFLFELHQSNGNSSEYFIKFKVNDDYFQPCFGIEGLLCPLEKFRGKVRSFQMENIDEECQDLFWQIETRNQNYLLSILFLLCGTELFLATTVFCLGHKILRNKRKGQGSLPSSLLELGSETQQQGDGESNKMSV